MLLIYFSLIPFKQESEIEELKIVARKNLIQYKNFLK